MVTGPIPATQVTSAPPAYTPPPPTTTTTATTQPTTPPPPPNYGTSTTTTAGATSTQSTSVAMRQTNGTDRVQISAQAMNASQNNPSSPSSASNVQTANMNQPATPPPPPIRANMSGAPQSAPRQPAGVPGGMTQAGSAPQASGMGVQQSGQFLNVFG